MNKFQIIYRINDNHLKEMIELDAQVFKGNDIGSFDKCKTWLTANQDIYTVLLYSNKVVGYINFVPVSEEFYLKFKNCEKKDFNLTPNDIVSFNSNKVLKCLFTSIVIHPDYQNGYALKKLWFSFLQKLKLLNVKISNVIMDCVTDIGEKCAINYLHANFISKSENGKIYEGTIQ